MSTLRFTSFLGVSLQRFRYFSKGVREYLCLYTIKAFFIGVTDGLRRLTAGRHVA
jgi:hypothetical protein